MIDGSGSLVKIGNGSLTLNGAGAFTMANVREGVLQLGASSAHYNEQLAHANLAVNGGAVTGWANKFGSVNLNSGLFKLNNAETIRLTDSGNVFSMNGGTLYVNVVDKTNHTNFKAEDPGATAQMNGGKIYVDTDTHGANLNIGDTLTILEVDPGNLTARPTNFTIYDDYAGMRFVVDPNELGNGYFNLLLKKTRSPTMRKRRIKEASLVILTSGKTDPHGTLLTTMFAALENAVEGDPALGPNERRTSLLRDERANSIA